MKKSVAFLGISFVFVLVMILICGGVVSGVDCHGSDDIIKVINKGLSADAPLSFGGINITPVKCSANYTLSQISYVGPWDYNGKYLFFCYQSDKGLMYNNGSYDFGGMYLFNSTTNLVKNPITNDYTCPDGFRGMNSNFISYNLTVCYRNKIDNHYGPWLFGGMYGSSRYMKYTFDCKEGFFKVDSTMWDYWMPYYINPVTGGYNCSEGYTPYVLVGSASFPVVNSRALTTDNLVYCMKENDYVPPTCTAATAAVDCNDGNICTTDSCVLGNCSYTNNILGCNDNNPNTSNDTCNAGVCSGITIVAPGASGANWTDLSGNVITSAQAGDSVRLFLGLGSGYSAGQTVNFMINATGSGGGVIYNISNPLVGVVNPNGLSATAVWKITNSDFGKTTSHNYIFSSLGKTSGVLSVSATENDSAMSVEILNPLCGDRITKGETRNILLNISDADDPVSGVLKINNVIVVNINNLLSSVSYTFNDSGNIKISLEGNNSRGFSKKYISNVMVVDEGVGVSGTYVAACIDKPKSNSLVNENPVRFIASSSKAIVRSGGSESLYSLSSPNSRFTLNWSFSDGYKYSITSGGNISSYNFTKAFLGAGEDVVAYLVVRFDNSSSSTIERVFSLVGCKVAGESGFSLGSCSNSGRWYCDLNGVVRDTVNYAGACDSISSGSCCPAGYACDLVNGSKKCVVRASSCTSYSSSSSCSGNSCFWFNNRCYDPSDSSLGCSFYGTNSSACTRDVFNLGRKGFGTGGCGTFTLGGKLILASSCKCSFSNGTCKLEYNSMDMFNSASGSFKCLKSFNAGECVDGKQTISWTANPDVVSGSTPTQAELTAAKCVAGTSVENCGQPVVRLPGFSFVNIIFVFIGLGVFYLITRKSRALTVS